jgi:hypothetical protein
MIKLYIEKFVCVLQYLLLGWAYKHVDTPMDQWLIQCNKYLHILLEMEGLTKGTTECSMCNKQMDRSNALTALEGHTSVSNVAYRLTCNLHFIR